jgi:ABC-type proline/glycine betaine transport system permease subunit
MTRYITETRSSAMEKLNKNNHSSAIATFQELRSYIFENIERFDLDKKVVDEVIKDIDTKTATINKAIFDTLNNERDNLVKTLFEKLGETNSAVVFMCLIDCAFFVPEGYFLQAWASKNSSLTVLFRIGWWTLLIYGIGLLFLIPAYIWQSSEVTYVKK